MGGALRSSNEHTQLAGASEHRLQRSRAFEQDVRGQLHLGHAVAVAWRECSMFSWAEDRHEPTYPVGTASLQDCRTQAIGSRLERVRVGHADEGVVGFAEA